MAAGSKQTSFFIDLRFRNIGRGISPSITVLLLSALPDLERGRALLEPGALSFTVRLQLHTEVKAKDVLNAMNAISCNFLKDQSLLRLSLVRPDEGWFQGLESVSFSES